MEGGGPHPVVRAAAYFDENFARAELIAALRDAGYEVHRAIDHGTSGWPDERQLEFAASRGFVVVTADRADFLRLHAAWMRAGRSHAGIVILHQDQYSVGERIRRMLRLMDAVSAEEFVDRVHFLSNWE
ncbi:MAG: DUF5615 family PIN-like protein [Dehalococcoidia bacterium]|nr:DUF5615 family PIN-like protein [Dehalococcoidia bacterium]